jgi:hypothetical protein
VSHPPRKFPKLVVEEPVLVPITPEQEERATEVLKALMVGYLRSLRAQGRWLDSDGGTVASSPDKIEEDEP